MATGGNLLGGWRPFASNGIRAGPGIDAQSPRAGTRVALSGRSYQGCLLTGQDIIHFRRGIPWSR